MKVMGMWDWLLQCLSAMRAKHIGGEKSESQEVNFKNRARLLWRGFIGASSKVHSRWGHLSAAVKVEKPVLHLFPPPLSGFSLAAVEWPWEISDEHFLELAWSRTKDKVCLAVGLLWSTGGHVSHYGSICAFKPNVSEKVLCTHEPVVNL